MLKLSGVRGVLVAIVLIVVHLSPLRAEGSGTPLDDELNALRQSIAEGHIAQGIDRLSVFRQQIDPNKDPAGYWTVSRQLLELLFQLEDTRRAESVLKSIVESKIGSSNPAIFQWTQLYLGEWLYFAGHGTEAEKFLRALTGGDSRLVLIPAQRAAAVLMSKIALQQGNVAQSGIWMRRAVIGVFEDKGAGSEEIVDILTEYAQFLSATRRFFDSFTLFVKLSPVLETGLPHTSPKYLHFLSLFLDVAPEIGKFDIADELYTRLRESADRSSRVAPSVTAELFFQGMYKDARSSSQSDKDRLRREVSDIVDKGADVLKYPIYRMSFMYFAIICNDIDLAERVDNSSVTQIAGTTQTDAYREALNSFIAAKRGMFADSISMLKQSLSNIETFHQQYEAETIDQLPALSTEERSVIGAVLKMDLPEAHSSLQQDVLFRIGQFLNRDRVKLGLNEAAARQTMKSELQREDDSTRDSLKRFRDQLLRDVTEKLLSTILPIHLPTAGKTSDYAVQSRLEDVDDKISVVDSMTIDGSKTEATRSVASIQGILKNSEALILQNIVPNGLAVQCITSDNVTTHVSVYGKDEIAQLVDDERKLSEKLHSAKPLTIQTDNSGLFPFESAYHLFKFYFGANHECLEGKSHILLATDPDLFAEPWNALITDLPPAGHGVGFREAAWFPRKYALSLLPSVRSIYEIRRLLGRSEAKRAFLGVGDPDLGPPEQSAALTLGRLFASRGVADVAEIKALPRLPDSAAELRSEASVLGASDSDLLLGSEAIERSLRMRPLQDYRIITFATHAIVAGEIPGTTEPALILTPMERAPRVPENGLLTSSKIAKLRLDANLVILSACNTAAPDGHEGGRGLSGLADAFFLAGARALAVTQWAVISSSTGKLASDLILQSAKRASVGVAESLRIAMLDYISNAESDFKANPRFWAAFMIAGDGAVNPSDVAGSSNARVITKNFERLMPGAADLELLGAAKAPGEEVYALGIEHPPPGERIGGSYLAKIDATGNPVVVMHEHSLGASGVDVVGDKIVVLGYRPYEGKSGAFFEVLNAGGDVLWNYEESADYWSFPIGIIPYGNEYLFISIQTDFKTNDHNLLSIARLSVEGKRIAQTSIAVSVRPDGVFSRNVTMLPSQKLLVAVRGSEVIDPKSPLKIWINPETGTRRICTQNGATELLQINPETLTSEKTRTFSNINITGISLMDGRILAVGTSTANCRLEKQANIFEIAADLKLNSLLRVLSVNSLEPRDMRVIGDNHLLLGGRSLSFLPTNPFLPKDSANEPETSGYDPWDDQFWDVGQVLNSGFLLLTDKNGSIRGDKVFSDPRGRSISTVLPWDSNGALVFGGAFGDRGWLAEVKVTTPPPSAPN